MGHVTQTLKFKDVDFNEYGLAQEDLLRRDGHKALWRYGDIWLVTWGSYVILASSSHDAIIARFNQIHTVREGMQAYEDFRAP